MKEEQVIGNLIHLYLKKTDYKEKIYDIIQNISLSRVRLNDFLFIIQLKVKRVTKVRLKT